MHCKALSPADFEPQQGEPRKRGHENLSLSSRDAGQNVPQGAWTLPSPSGWPGHSYSGEMPGWLVGVLELVDLPGNESSDLECAWNLPLILPEVGFQWILCKLSQGVLEPYSPHVRLSPLGKVCAYSGWRFHLLVCGLWCLPSVASCVMRSQLHSGVHPPLLFQSLHSCPFLCSVVAILSLPCLLECSFLSNVL